jgi:magnesium transporter
MTRTLAPDVYSPHSHETGVTMRVVYRDGGGSIHQRWPVERIAEALEDRAGTTWVDIEDRESPASTQVEALLRDVFHFHMLAIEDALKEIHVPRLDDWGDYLYVVFHTLDFDPETDQLRLHELDIFLGKNYLVTYHNHPIPEIEQHWKNIERDPVNRCRNGADHILYHVLDLIVAAYLPAIEHLDDAIDDAQDEVFDRPSPQTLRKIFQVKRSALRLNRILGPEREVINRLARDDYDPIPPEHRVYFRDIYDHLVRVHDITEGLRDLISGALDTYLSAVSNRTNDIMKTLTIVTVMFLPMSFLTGWFGMNFFGDSLTFHAAMPKRLLFTFTCLTVVVTPPLIWLWARRRRWF